MNPSFVLFKTDLLMQRGPILCHLKRQENIQESLLMLLLYNKYTRYAW